MSIESYTGDNINNTIKNKLKLNEKRLITARTIGHSSQNEYNNIRIRCLYKMLNRKVILINNIYRNYKIRKYNKLNNSYKKLILHLPFNDNKYIFNDIIENNLNSLIIINK